MTPSESTERLFLQILWDWLREWTSLLRSPCFPVLFSLSVYMCCCFPYICLDLLCSRLALVRRFKIQPQSKVTWAATWRCLCKISRNHVCFIFPLSVVHWYWKPVVSPPVAPAMLAVVKDVLACLLLFDTQYFFWHLLHHKVYWLYRFFHKEHHVYTATFSLTTEDTSVWEMLSLSFFTTLNPVLLDCHPLTEMLFFIANIYLSVEAHSGYEFPWSPHRLVPFGLYGGAQHHDLHHLKFKVNYAPYFTHWDRLFGTLHTQKKSRNTETLKRMCLSDSATTDED
ncbi:cholesterol 25-hydroxylase-like protein [Seriola dumerili]|uniref:cholesterol 25-hydroxylase-like protein n=1 Tax=Seriola dumerili TaxID=41447 RepID=UPI000BBE69AE|nr:cholesterol 25-hydroxylase-like protein [Seriola dumerili]